MENEPSSDEAGGNGGGAYQEAGVSIQSGNELVNRIKPHVASTARPGASATIGGFGGLFNLASAGYSASPSLIGAIDGVGTKLMVAHAMNKHDTVGIDLVAMNVNDLVVQGAEPIFFLDCFSCGKLDVNVAEAFVKGVSAGCREAGCALIGGETAEMPGLFSSKGGTYDAVGAAVGAVAQGRTLLPDKESMEVGDVLLGLGSSGCHSNGFTLVRSVVEKAGLSYHEKAPWEDTDRSVGESLLTPTRIYVRSLMGVASQNLIKGMAHITGGGLTENVPRMLPENLAADIDVKTWEVPAVLQWLRSTGKLPNEEFARVFNTGLGMVLVVGKANVAQTIRELEAAGETVYTVGKLIERTGEAGCILRNMHLWS